MKPVALTREQKIRKSVRGFIITFLVFLIFRYYLAELALNNKPSMKRGMVLSLFYAMAYVVSSNTL
jgi:multisubunit Na+/H+ antiporter MnhE subunit